MLFMIPKFNKVHNRFKLNGSSYNATELKDYAHYFIKNGKPFERKIGNFLVDWLDHSNYIESNTSGSTGTPKTIQIQKQAMVNSAIATANYFSLKPRDKAFNCLPVDSIAGKMMLVRAMVIGLELDLVNPSKSPNFDTDKSYEFCAMIPLQLYNSLDNVNNIMTIIIGGAPASKQLLNNIQSLSPTVYETFGMTETVSHIAVKQLNHLENNNDFFKLLPNVKISQDDRKCLMVKAPKITEETLITNDIIDIIDNDTFKWLGRYDNIINSGGVKLYPESIENKLQSKIPQRLLITSIKNEEFGEKLVLIIEGKKEKIPNSIFDCLDKFERPKDIVFIPQFAETPSGKIHRKNTLNLLEK